MTVPITLAGIEAALAAGERPSHDEVVWLVETLRGLVGVGVEPVVESDEGWVAPTTEELVAEFGLGPDPSPDMIAYLSDFVRDREAERRAAEEQSGD